MSEERIQYTVKECPDFNDTNTRLKARFVLGSMEEVDFQKLRWENLGAQGVCDIFLNESEKRGLEELGGVYEEYVYVCICGYCCECHEKKRQKALDSLSESDRLAVEQLRNKSEEMIKEMRRDSDNLSDGAKKVWDNCINPLRMMNTPVA